MMHRVQFEQWVPFGIERVFLFFANPENLPRIMPPENGTELVRLNLIPPPDSTRERPIQPASANQGPLAGAGSEVVTSFRVLPFLPLRAQWIALISEFEWNHHFADTQKKGPFKSFLHRHQLRAEVRDGSEGTVVCDQIDYEVGWGWLGELANKLFIRRQMRRTFAYRQQELHALLQ
jgi:ligand-binding SRPBCC domain-containing protein